MVAPSAPDFCTDVTPECPVEGTIYGYYPSLGANVFFCAFFGIAFLAQLIQGVKWRTWTFMIALSLGALCEAIGYVGRILMHRNPFSSAGFNMQICCLIIAPAFISAGIYLTLKHLVYSFGEEFSRIPPNWYTWIFICCDLLSLILQGAGGGTAASAAHGSNAINIGSDLMLAGIIFQVVVLAIFGCFLVEYLVRVYLSRSRLSEPATALSHDLKFRLFLAGVFIAYITILTRCIYRIPEMSGGWRNEIMRNETEFIVLDGVMITIATAALTIFHPGYCFPALSNTMGSKRSTSAKNFSEDSFGKEQVMAV